MISKRILRSLSLILSVALVTTSIPEVAMAEAVPETFVSELSEEGKEEVSENDIFEDNGKDVSEADAEEETLEETVYDGVDAGEYLYSGQDKDITWSIDKNGHLVLEGEGDCAVPAPRWTYDKTVSASIKTAEVKVTGVTRLDLFFYNCDNLTEVDLTGLDTSNVTSMFSMFSGCSSLKNIDVTGFDTSKVESMESMFSGCMNLETLDVSGFNTSSVKTMLNMFNMCQKLKSLDVSNFDTSNVTNMAGMFLSCSALETLDVSKFNTSKVTYMDNMFFGCSALSVLDVSNFDTSEVTLMNDMFWGCSGLEIIDVSGFNTAKVTNMDGMFGGCNTLKKLYVSGFDTAAVENMQSMFFGCTLLEKLDVSGFDTGKVTNMGGMFQGCSALKSIYVSGFDTSKVTSMAYMFSNCYGFTSLDVSNFNTSSLTNMCAMFSGNKNLESIKFGGFDTSNVTNMGSLFAECPKLVNFDISNWDVSKVTTMTNMFYQCTALKTLDLSNFVTSSLTEMGGMFMYCENLESLKIDNFDTSKVTAFCSLFNCCHKLKNIDVSNFVTVSSNDMTEMFYGCNDLESLDVSNFDTSNVVYMNAMFGWCSSLESLDLSSFDMKNVITANEFFYRNFDPKKFNCTNLKSIKSPKNITVDISLPSEGKGWTTTDSDGNVVECTQFIKNSDVSIEYSFVGQRHSITYKDCDGAKNPNPSEYTEGFGLVFEKPVKPGYTFNYWYTKKGKKTTVITKIPDTATADYTVYAKWTPVSYKVTFKSNTSFIKDYYEGTKTPSSSGKMKAQTLKGGSGSKLTANSFAVKGYKFIGWNTAEDGTGKSFSNKEKIYSFEGGSKNITLYAMWEKVTYSINYKGLTGEDVSACGLPKTYQVDSDKITFAEYSGQVIKTGYVFKGWFKDKKYTKKMTSINAGSTGNKTVYVKMAANKYKISFVRNESSINNPTGNKLKASGSMKKQTFTYGKSAKLSANQFKIPGYRFCGWSTEADGSVITYSNKEQVINLSSENGAVITLYAIWEKVPYIITYKGITEEERAAFGLPRIYYVDSEKINYADYTERIVKEGYSFKGWFKDKKFTKKMTSINTGSTGNKTVYLKFKKNK